MLKWKGLARAVSVVVLAVAVAGCALFTRPTLKGVSDEFGLDVLSAMLTALDADDFSYFMTCYDLEALAKARGKGPITSSSLPYMNSVVREHWEGMKDLKDSIRSGIRFYGVIGSRVGTLQLSVAGALSTTPLSTVAPGGISTTISTGRGYWIINSGEEQVKIRLTRPGGRWKIEDMEWGVR